MCYWNCCAPARLPGSTPLKRSVDESWLCASRIFLSFPLFSLTPCFSGVLPALEVPVNRFNGFRSGSRQYHRYRTIGFDGKSNGPFPLTTGLHHPKTVKTVGLASGPPNTPLKQGVNESRSPLPNSACRESVLPRSGKSLCSKSQSAASLKS